MTQTAEDYAAVVFPHLEFEKVLAYKSRIKPSYGCTYLVLRLPKTARSEPPQVYLPDTSKNHDLMQKGFWHSTPEPHSLNSSAHYQCLVGDPQKFDGAGVAGYAAQISAILQQPAAWFTSFGGVEGRKLFVYAPEARLAVVLRFGD